MTTMKQQYIEAMKDPDMATLIIEALDQLRQELEAAKAEIKRLWEALQSLQIERDTLAAELRGK